MIEENINILLYSIVLIIWWIVLYMVYLGRLYKIDFEILILGGYYGILGGFVNWILDLKCLCDKY